MKKLLVVLAILSFGLVAFATEQTTLDGKTFTGKIGSSVDKKQKYDDDLIFKEGTFTSTACEQQGFSPTTYTTTTEGKKTVFNATATNAKGEKMVWKGTITGKQVKADIENVDATGKTEKWWYKGTAKK